MASIRGAVHYNALVLREPYSGVEVTVHGLASALATHGSTPLHIHLPHTHRALPSAPHLTLSHAPEAISRSRLLRILWEQSLLPLRLRRARAALLHAPAYVAPVLAPCPTVLTIHDLHALTHPRFCSRSNRAHYRLLLPPSVRRAAAIIVFSDYVRRIVLEHFPNLPAERLNLIPPGVDMQRCTDTSSLNQARERYNLPIEYLLFVGDLTERKNTRGLIGAFAKVAARHPELHLLLAGNIDQANLCAVTAEASRHRVWHKVIMPGYVDAADLPAIYTMARVFVFPSHDEGFGVPPLEAMACGCPVVCSGGAPVEICGQAAITCQPDDYDSIAAGISALLENPELRRAKITAGQTRAADFSWRRAALATEALYNRTLTGRRRSTRV